MDRIENIDYCIRYLLEQNRTQADIPATLPDKQRLLWALMNVTASRQSKRVCSAEMQ